MLDAIDTALRATVEQFLYDEARLLDQRRYRDWERLWADDATYSIPAVRDAEDPGLTVSILHADRAGIADRVARLAGGHAYAQDPPSDTTRLVANVVAEAGGDGIVVARSVLLIHEFRRDREHLWSGHVEHELVPADGDGRFAIRRKTVVLTNCDRVLPSLTFLV
jgi:ethylbenzene dioxygenase beta subunit